MQALLLAKRRESRRAGEAGAAMFVIAMTLAVLASVGVYALAAAANEVRTSGNERQSTQTHYLAEYGVIGANHEIIASKAQYYVGLMFAKPEAQCVSLPGVTGTAAVAPITKACRRLGSSELGGAWATAVTVPYTAAAYQSGTTPGSLGPVPMTGDFFIELTEPAKAHAAARYATDLSFCFIRMTVTSNGITQPIIASSASDTLTGQYGNEGLEVQRARLIAGPVQCPK
jgi:Tfp pilus assembly protein PilX